MAFSFDDLKSRGDDRNDGMDDFTEEMGEAAAELHPRATATTIVRDDSGTLCFGEEVECRSEPCHEVLQMQRKGVRHVHHTGAAGEELGVVPGPDQAVGPVPVDGQRGLARLLRAGAAHRTQTGATKSQQALHQ